MDSTMILFYTVMAGALFLAYWTGMKWGIQQGIGEGYEEGYYAALEDVKQEMAKQGIKMEYDARDKE